MAAAAACLLVRVFELESLLHQRLLPLELRAAQVEQALGIDHDANGVPSPDV